MAHRPSTVVQDKKILRLWKNGVTTKRIVERLNLSSDHVVYEARRRARDRQS